jgi:LCP family protein required for cell wall assembly
VPEWPQGWTRDQRRRDRRDDRHGGDGRDGRYVPDGRDGRESPQRHPDLETTRAAPRAGRSDGPDHTRVLPSRAPEQQRRQRGRDTVDPYERPVRGAPAPPPFGRPARRRPGRLLRRALLALLLVLALLLALVLYFFARVAKVDALQDYDGRPDPTPGTTWLLVGSDSREGLTAEERRRLRTGSTEGRRTDTIILLHSPSDGGPPTLVSLPRDSYVPVPGRGRNKLNAAYAIGGAPLLAQTVERVTGIRVDHYAEIGFGGFVGVVDALGDVELCPQRDIKDRRSGLDVRKGCQPMDGATSLAYVRARYFDPKGDLGRVQRQQEFLSAIFAKAASPGVLLNPVRLVRLGNAGTKALTVDEGDGPIDLVRFALVMRAVSGEGGRRTTVPVADPDYRTPVGSAVRWDRTKARALFNSLR